MSARFLNVTAFQYEKEFEARENASILQLFPDYDHAPWGKYAEQCDGVWSALKEIFPEPEEYASFGMGEGTWSWLLEHWHFQPDTQTFGGYWAIHAEQALPSLRDVYRKLKRGELEFEDKILHGMLGTAMFRMSGGNMVNCAPPILDKIETLGKFIKAHGTVVVY
jgi:hypothetical protein